MDEQRIAVQIEHVTKTYRLGVYNSKTFLDELRRRRAARRGQDDPRLKIGQNKNIIGHTIYALNDVSLTIYEGESIGIIGINGAGKSTLLKLISHITVPTSGRIGINGRISSMLEVGVGFMPEMTGKENIYLNGAILGMTTAEVTRKLDQIIAFSECEDFIGTPLKRYSSGMRVKLAFSVAAHLDNEIMIMDEVLAVGDAQFQHKCIKRMSDAARLEGKTVLYVSHNMNTIRELCSRCIVLDKGRVIFDGNTEEAIALYLKEYADMSSRVELSDVPRKSRGLTRKAHITSLSVADGGFPCIKRPEPLCLEMEWDAVTDIPDGLVLVRVHAQDGTLIGTAYSTESVHASAGEHHVTRFELDSGMFGTGQYLLGIGLSAYACAPQQFDEVSACFGFEIISGDENDRHIYWNERTEGHVAFLPVFLSRDEIRQGDGR